MVAQIIIIKYVILLLLPLDDIFLPKLIKNYIDEHRIFHYSHLVGRRGTAAPKWRKLLFPPPLQLHQ